MFAKDAHISSDDVNLHHPFVSLLKRREQTSRRNDQDSCINPRPGLSVIIDQNSWPITCPFRMARMLGNKKTALKIITCTKRPP